jgi:hypothetical protein
VQGNIVIGHTTNYEVGPENAQYLRRLSRKLAADLNSDIQLEFVIDKRQKIVQLQENKAVSRSCSMARLCAYVLLKYFAVEHLLLCIFAR